MSEKGRLLTSAEFRERARISRPTEHRARKSGKLACFKIGSRVFYSEKHLADFLARHEQPARAEGSGRRAA